MAEVADYENLCTRVNTIITRRNLKIRVVTLNHESSIEQYDFIIYDANSEIVKLTGISISSVKRYKKLIELDKKEDSL